MKKEKMTAWTRTLILCMIFAICCVLFAFAPHFHECADSNCSACALIKVVCDALSVLSVGIAISLPLIGYLPFFAYFSLIHSVREATPVGRKVKLSD